MHGARARVDGTELASGGTPGPHVFVVMTDGEISARVRCAEATRVRVFLSR